MAVVDASQRAFFDDLARRLSREDGLQLARDLQTTGILSAAEPAPDPVKPVAEKPQPISIWQPVHRDGTQFFERPPSGPFGDHYAARLRIAAEKPTGTRRICFFGESVAAGYLLAPHLTPAGVLEHQLNVRCPNRYEVIDLARTNETLAGLKHSVQASLQLQPDALVIFTGNNWHLLEEPQLSPYTPHIAGRQDFARHWRERGGPRGPMHWAREVVLRKAATHLHQVAEIARAAGLPVILIVPEVNQRDWFAIQPPLWLPGNKNARWFETWHVGCRQWQKGAFTAAAQTALDLVDLDGETNPSGCSLLARAKADAGQFAMAREATKGELSTVWPTNMCFLDSPRLTEPGRQLLQRIAQVHGFRQVDCRALFATQRDATPPGREWFLDYCHLTPAGIRLTMAAVVQQVMHTFDEDGAEARWLAEAPLPPFSKAAEATALLGAAIHTAHRLFDGHPQGAWSAPLYDHWCHAALACDEKIVATMLDLAATRAAAMPAVLHAAQQRNGSSDHPLSLQHGWRYDYVDGPLLASFQRVLQQRSPEHAQRLQATLLTEAANVGQLGTDLLPRGLSQPTGRRFTELLPHPDHLEWALFRAFWPTTDFSFILPQRCPLQVEICARMARRAASAPLGQLSLAINGQTLPAINLSTRWQRQWQTLPVQALRPGLNHLRLTWPVLTADGDQAITAMLTRLAKGQAADIHPCFGELERLRLHA